MESEKEEISPIMFLGLVAGGMVLFFVALLQLGVLG